MESLYQIFKKSCTRIILAASALVLWVVAAGAQVSYPYNFTYNGNPLSRIHGAADPDAHVWDDTVWVYCSQDHEGGYANMDGYHVFSSTDMVHWTDHGDVFNSSMLDESRWGPTPEAWMWAPGAARKQNENGEWTYYLYYPHNVSFSGQDWITGVATAPTPAGPFTDQGPLRNGEMHMDPMVFMDDDGTAYIYSNSLIVARLEPDMITLAETPRKIDYAPDSIRDNEMLRFSEGSYMHKRDGIYYYSYSNFHNDDFQGFYAMGESPYGPFTWQGPMAPNPQGAQDHHSLIEFEGQWYYFYHIAVPDLPFYKDGQSRIACFDRLYYNKDGTVQTVVHTYGPTNVLHFSASNGTITLEPPGGAYGAGTEVSLSVSSDLGYAFESWSGDLTGSENPIMVTMDSGIHVTANFIPTPTYTLTTTAANGTIQLDPPGGIYNANTAVSLTPVDDFGYNFNSWSGDLSGSDIPATIIMDADKNVIANFIQAPVYDLTIASTNGIVHLYPPGGSYEQGTEVKLEAASDFGYGFSGWTGDTSGFDNPIKLIMDSDKTITANYTYIGGGTIVFATNCGGEDYRSSMGIVYSKDNSISGGGTFKAVKEISGTTDDILYQSERFGSNFSYHISLPNGVYEVTLSFAEIFHSSAGKRVFDVAIENTEVISNLDLVQKAGANTAYQETHTVNVDDGELTISFSAKIDNAKVSAISVIKPDASPVFTLKTNITNGFINLYPPGGKYIKGAVIAMKATANAGYYFKEWSGDYNGTDNPAFVTMDTDKNITAEIRDANSFSLTLNAADGAIHAYPEKDVYHPGAAVILEALPDSGYAFSEWIGDLSGSSNPESIIMDSNKTVTALFSALSNVNNDALNKLPQQNKLFQNFPNPFSKKTLIPYQLQEASRVRLSVYNMLGELSACLVDEYQPAGYHEVAWYPSDIQKKKLTGGPFIYQLEICNTTVITMKAILQQ